MAAAPLSEFLAARHQMPVTVGGNLFVDLHNACPRVWAYLRATAAGVSKGLLTWGVAASSTVGLGSGVSAVLIATHIVEAPSIAAVMLGVMFVVPTLASSVVRVAENRTNRSPEIRRAEQRAAAMERVDDPEHALVLDTFDTVVTAKKLNSADIDKVLGLVREIVSTPEPKPDLHVVVPGSVAPAQAGDRGTSSDEQFQQIVTSAALKPGNGRLISA